jgi:CheY-like chemotaxis protein
MLQYEEDTGKYAIWRGKVTDGFQRWKAGEKIYDKDKERISFYVSEDTKAKWKEFAEIYNYSTISKLIREAVNNFIEKKATLYNKSLEDLNIDALSHLSHSLKEPLTSIKGYLQLLIEGYKDRLDGDISDIINKVLAQSSLLENKIVEDLDHITVHTNSFDILIIEDNIPTINLLRDYFESKGFTCKCALTGDKGLKSLNHVMPKLILLDIILPDINGFEICKSIKNNDRTKDIPVIYLTAVPGTKVEEMMEETKADDKILKPFNLTDLEFLFKYV